MKQNKYQIGSIIVSIIFIILVAHFLVSNFVRVIPSGFHKELYATKYEGIYNCPANNEVGPIKNDKGFPYSTTSAEPCTEGFVIADSASLARRLDTVYIVVIVTGFVLSQYYLFKKARH